MKVLLLNTKSLAKKKCINRDLAGGLGTGTWVGQSLRARLFEYIKRRSVVLPEITEAYLVSIFKKAGWEVKCLEAENEKNIPRESADLVLISSSIVDCHHELKIAKILKEKGYYVGSYGTFASVVPELFGDSVDFVIRGEPESGVLNMIAANKLPQGIFDVPLVENLDDLPYPDWSQVAIHKFNYYPALPRRPVLTMVTSRGCPHSCFFYCPYPINSGKGWRSRSIANVIGEMEYLKKEYDVRGIHFRDPIFTFNQERIYEFAEELRQRRLDISWSCETRLDCLDKKLIKEMYKAGLRHVNVGIESSDGALLKKAKRLPIQSDHQEEIISFCEKMGITVAAFYIMGLPGDTEESVRQTIHYAKKLNTSVAQFGIITPYPGTPFFTQLQKEGRITSLDWENYDSYTPVFQHESLSHEKLLALKEMGFVSYYFRISYFLKHLPLFFGERFH